MELRWDAQYFYDDTFIEVINKISQSPRRGVIGDCPVATSDWGRTLWDGLNQCG